MRDPDQTQASTQTYPVIIVVTVNTIRFILPRFIPLVVPSLNVERATKEVDRTLNSDILKLKFAHFNRFLILVHFIIKLRELLVAKEDHAPHGRHFKTSILRRAATTF